MHVNCNTIDKEKCTLESYDLYMIFVYVCANRVGRNLFLSILNPRIRFEAHYHAWSLNLSGLQIINK